MKVSVRKKILLGFLSVVMLLGLTGGIFYFEVKKMDESYSDLVDRRAEILSHAKDVQNYASREISSLRAILLREEGAYDSLKEVISGLEFSVQQMEGLVQLQNTKDEIQKITSLNMEFVNKVEQVVEMLRTRPEEASRIAIEEAMPLARSIRDDVDALVSDQDQRMKEGSKANSELVDSINFTIIVLNLSALLLALAISALVARMISKPISAMASAAKSIADGNLNIADISVKNRDEIGSLAESFNLMKRNLHDLISQIGWNSTQVAATSEQLSASAEESTKATELISNEVQEVAAGAEKQMTLSDESTQAVVQIQDQMNQAASTIHAMASYMESTNNKAISGNQVVLNTVDQMNAAQASVGVTVEVVHDLNRKLQEIGQIVNLMTDIARQTNLLALNAGIEAARAGEHGGGFGVVAKEVRGLAAHSNDAAEQIKSLIQEVQTKSEHAVRAMNEGAATLDNGIQLVHRTGDTFQEIANSVERLTEGSRNISEMFEQVTQRAVTMTESIEHMARISRQSAANTQNVAASAEEQNASMEEVSAAAESLSSMALELQATIKKFAV
ncbi:methyl-accepting chemotaxis protein [Paenibacillus sp. FSL R5-0407]|uniref:methyl-accepting chemotaxis protein n=1 Tax=Paenibacillus TaxID=44249 RepID=UPI0025B6B228|nr:methyl-accepting chemotaxis protein [Paenibacillus vini]MDN4070628.1 methyl-accepting chemotaxis protein [Paenibacillus vini]